MKIRNKKNSANYVNFKDKGTPKKMIIAAGTTVDIPTLLNKNQIINLGDFNRGFFEIIEKEESVVEDKISFKSSPKNKVEDSLDKVKKEVRKYTESKE